MMKIVIDTWAWIEYFEGSKDGEKARKYIEGNYELIVPAVVVAELSNKYRTKGMSRIWEEKRKPFLEMMCFIVPMETWIANEAGRIKSEQRKKHPEFGLADAMILATRELTGGRILTGDKHLFGNKSIDIS